MNLEHAKHGLREWLASFAHPGTPPPADPPAVNRFSFGQQHTKDMAQKTAEDWFSRLSRPASVFTVACVSISALALASAWTLQKREKSREAQQDFHFDASPPRTSRKVPLSPPRRAKQDYHSRIADLLASVGRNIQTCRSLDSRDRDDISRLADELPSTINALCQVQQLLSLFHGTFNSQQGLRPVFETVLSGLSEIMANLDEEMKRVQEYSHQLGNIDEITQQLKDQRESLVFIIDSISRHNAGSSSSAQYSQEASTIVEQSPEFPHEDIKKLIEHPPEVDDLPRYTPSTDASSDTLSAMDAKALLPAPVEMDSTPLGPKGTATTAMVMATVSANDIEELESLVQTIDPNAVHGRLRRTALHQAARLNRVECARILIQNGALVDQEDGKGDNPIHLACWEGHVEVTKLFMRSGADIDALSGRDGNSPLFCAIVGRNIDVARVLLKHGARVNLRSLSEMTALHQAAITGQGAICELLVERGANVDVQDNEGNTPLHYAATNGDVRTARVLLAEKAEIDARQETGLTPLHWAALKGNDDILRYLLDEGADANAESDSSTTPLHCAAAQGNIGCVKILLRRDASPHMVTSDWDGLKGTPEQIASQKKHAAIARLIKKHAAGRSSSYSGL